MKIILISDIHANAFYFREFFNTIARESYDRIICLGDLVGYYDEPNEVIDLCRQYNIECIKGNHEEYLFGTLKYKESQEHIYRIKLHRDILSFDNKKYLKELPSEIIITDDSVSIYCTHALPANSAKYLYNPSEILDEYIQGYDYYCSGHTHIPYIQYTHGTCVVNPGSIGQPRDYTSEPSYVIIDLLKKEVLIKKIRVDTDIYIEKLQEKNIDIKLIDILRRKKK